MDDQSSRQNLTPRISLQSTVTAVPLDLLDASSGLTFADALTGFSSPLIETDAKNWHVFSASNAPYMDIASPESDTITEACSPQSSANWEPNPTSLNAIDHVAADNNGQTLRYQNRSAFETDIHTKNFSAELFAEEFSPRPSCSSHNWTPITYEGQSECRGIEQKSQEKTDLEREDKFALAAAAIAADAQGTRTPLIKEEIRYKIQCKRRNSGLDDAIVNYAEPTQEGLSAEDLERRSRRRERNRAAAARCREKKKAQAENVVKEFTELETNNHDLRRTVSQLLIERNQLQFVLDEHLRQGCNLTQSSALPPDMQK